MSLDDLDLFQPDDRVPLAQPAKCRRHRWGPAASTPECDDMPPHTHERCTRCGRARDATASRRGRNNRARGNRDELVVARLLGGEKVGPLGLPWDVTVPGYMRVQCKRLDRWPALAKVVEWLDAIPQGVELRAVTIADTPGAGGRTRRLIVLDLDEFASWHGRDPK